MRARISSRQNARLHVYASCARVYARIFMKNHLIILYYLMNKSLKSHKDRSFCCWDICKTILTFVLFLIFLLYLYYLMNLSIKFHKYRSYGSGDISKTILTFVQSLIFYVFCIFSKFEHQSSTNLENCKLGIWSFGNLISKCNRLSEHIKHIPAIEVL